MKKSTILTRALAPVAGAAALALVAAPAFAGDEEKAKSTEMTKGEKKLAKLLEGRVAGEPVNCINTFRNIRMQTIDKTAYVYGSGKTIYVQRTARPEQIDDSDALVTRRFGSSQLCRQDVITTVDPVLGFFTGAVFFEDFVPYTRVEGNEDNG